MIDVFVMAKHPLHDKMLKAKIVARFENDRGITRFIVSSFVMEFRLIFCNGIARLSVRVKIIFTQSQHTPILKVITSRRKAW